MKNVDLDINWSICSRTVTSHVLLPVLLSSFLPPTGGLWGLPFLAYFQSTLLLLRLVKSVSYYCRRLLVLAVELRSRVV